MSTKLPVVSGDELVRALGKIGYLVVRQKGSHMRLRHSAEANRKPLSIPRKKVIKRGLLKDISAMRKSPWKASSNFFEDSGKERCLHLP